METDLKKHRYYGLTNLLDEIIALLLAVFLAGLLWLGEKISKIFCKDQDN